MAPTSSCFGDNLFQLPIEGSLEDTMRTRILITGAAGTVGIALLEQLSVHRDSFDIYAFDLNHKVLRKKISQVIKKYPNSRSRIHPIYRDIRDVESFDGLPLNFEVIIHLAALIPPAADDHKRLAYQVNTLGTKGLLQFAHRQISAPFFLYSSSVAIYGDRLKTPWIQVGDPLHPSRGDFYAKTKIAAEKIVKSYHGDWSIFRLGAVMGGHQISKLMFHQPLETHMEIITAEDTARAFVGAIYYRKELSGNIYNLGGGEACRMQYKDFLQRSFEIRGLGKLTFPRFAFADQNFHCGYFKDGMNLHSLLHFSKDSMESYFIRDAAKVRSVTKGFLHLLRRPIKWWLLQKSEPYHAIKKGDVGHIRRYFSTPLVKTFKLDLSLLLEISP